MSEQRSGLSRRGLLGAGVAAVGGAAAFGHVRATGEPTERESNQALRHPFHGERQAGILTPMQDSLHFAAFDVITSSRDELIDLLRRWTDIAERLTRGARIGDPASSYHAPPGDTGEVTDIPPAGLTITFGFGPTLFRTADGHDRFDLAARQPATLTRLPTFRGDRIDPERSYGDLCVQACANDPVVAVHAIRNLTRAAFGIARVRWSQLGFDQRSSPDTPQETSRNLFGFKDGTANLSSEDPEALNRHVWVGASADPAASWLAGGTFLVTRRIAMHLETWDRAALMEQEAMIGRTKAEGAPLSGGTEFSEPNFRLTGRNGRPLISARAHVALVHPSKNNGVQLLRRSYKFVDGTDDLGRLNAGEFFMAFCIDPHTHYVPLQHRLATLDVMSDYLQATSSGVWAIPPGIRAGEFAGQALFD
ncbi:MAG: iron uptake transporter deferrochelatase/peroxidase subunit [Propionibacteriaceae bacterium]|nr:iron uptake transporter deferrochelatase/peroxidase subunit [Propionibacteriaceae bacterium]